MAERPSGALVTVLVLQQLSDCQRAQADELSRLLESNRVLMLQQQSLIAAQRAPRFQGSRPRNPAGNPACTAPAQLRFQPASSLYSAQSGQGGQPSGQPSGQAGVYPQLAMARHRGASALPPPPAPADQVPRTCGLIIILSH